MKQVRDEINNKISWKAYDQPRNYLNANTIITEEQLWWTIDRNLESPYLTCLNNTDSLVKRKVKNVSFKSKS